MKKTTKPVWATPWSYRESFIIGFSLVFTGFFIEYITASKSGFALMFPDNIIFGIVYTVLLLLIYIFLQNRALVKWLLSVPAAISLFVILIVLVMVMGIIPQDLNYGGKLIRSLGLNKISSNWAFLFIILVFLTSLGLVTIKRISNILNKKLDFNVKNISFVLSHFGLWFTVLVAFLGAGDIQIVRIKLDKQQPYNVAFDLNNNEFLLDFYIHLKEFKVEEYPPKLAIVDNKSGEVIHNNGKNLFEINDSLEYQFNDLNIKVEDYIYTSAPIGKKYAPVYQPGSLPSAKVSVSGDSINKAGWISCGNFMYQYQSLKINDDYSLLMTIPEVKHFESIVDLYSKEGVETDVSIEVNNLYDYKGYKIYQVDYDEGKGRWSTYSTLELVKDPWLPFVYTGLGVLIFCSVILLLYGKQDSETKNL